MSDRSGFDPYSTITIPVSRLAPFYGGRCLARIYWHFQPGFVLGSKFDPQAKVEHIRRNKAAHLTNGYRVVDTLSTLAGLTGVDTADRVSRDIRRHVADWKENQPVSGRRRQAKQGTKQVQHFRHCPDVGRSFIGRLIGSKSRNSGP